MITPTTDGATAPSPAGDPATVTALIHVRLRPVWLLSLLAIVVLVLVTFVLNMGFAFEQSMATVDDPEAHATSLLEQYNTIVGSLASAVSTPAEWIVSSILTLAVLRHTLVAASDRTTDTPQPILERAKTGLFKIVFSKLVLLSLITAGFTSVYVDMLPKERVTRQMNGADLGKTICDTCGTGSQSVDQSFVLQTVLRTAFVPKVVTSTIGSHDPYSPEPSALNPSIARLSPNLKASFTTAPWMLQVGPLTPISTTLDDRVVLELTFQGLAALLNGASGSANLVLKARQGYSQMRQEWLQYRTSGNMRDFVKAQFALYSSENPVPGIKLTWRALFDMDTFELKTERYQLAEHVEMDMIVVRVKQQLNLTATKSTGWGSTMPITHIYRTSGAECGQLHCVFPPLRDQEIARNATLPVQHVAVNVDLHNCFERWCPDGTCPPRIIDTKDDLMECVVDQTSTNASSFLAYGYSALMDTDGLQIIDGLIVGHEPVDEFVNPRKVHEFAFARVHWEAQDLSARHHATCIANASDCFGVQLTTPTKTTILRGTGKPGTTFFPTLSEERMLFTLDHPERHVEFLPTQAYQSKNPMKGSSALVDAYDSSIRTNQLYIEDLRTPMYLSSLFYLFGDGAVRQPDPIATDGALILDGDNRVRVMRFRVQVPLIASIQTLVGCCLLIVAIVMITLHHQFDKRLETPEDVHAFITHVWHTTLPAMFLDRFAVNAKGRMPIDNTIHVQTVTLYSKDDKIDAMEIRTRTAAPSATTTDS